MHTQFPHSSPSVSSCNNWFVYRTYSQCMMLWCPITLQCWWPFAASKIACVGIGEVFNSNCMLLTDDTSVVVIIDSVCLVGSVGSPPVWMSKTQKHSQNIWNKKKEKIAFNYFGNLWFFFAISVCQLAINMLPQQQYWWWTLQQERLKNITTSFKSSPFS